MRISYVWVNKLFGLFDHKVSFENRDRLLILNAPNGYGKTAILKMISGFFSGNFEIFLNYPFMEFGIAFTDDNKAVISKIGQDKDQDLMIEYKNIENETMFKFTFSRSTLFKPHPDKISREIDELTRIAPSLWRNKITNEVYNYIEVIKHYGFRLMSRENIMTDSDELKWLTKLMNSINVKYIDTQRLLMKSKQLEEHEFPSQNYLRPSVTIIKKRVAKRIQEVQLEFARVSQALDRTFPKRLLYEENSNIYEEGVLKKLLKELEEKRESYTKAGLLDKSESFDFTITDEIYDNNRRVLSFYVDDSLKKLKTLESIARKTETFSKIVNGLFAPLKKIQVNKNEGLIVTNILGEKLDLSMLSSGEQHELILWYELLFNTPSGTLLLIDEPEISLHVSWQQEFTENLINVANFFDFDVIIATHASGIISGNWDRVVDLDHRELWGTENGEL